MMASVSITIATINSIAITNTGGHAGGEVQGNDDVEIWSSS